MIPFYQNIFLLKNKEGKKQNPQIQKPILTK